MSTALLARSLGCTVSATPKRLAKEVVEKVLTSHLKDVCKSKKISISWIDLVDPAAAPCVAPMFGPLPLAPKYRTRHFTHLYYHGGGWGGGLVSPAALVRLGRDFGTPLSSCDCSMLMAILDPYDFGRQAAR